MPLWTWVVLGYLALSALVSTGLTSWLRRIMDRPRPGEADSRAQIANMVTFFSTHHRHVWMVVWIGLLIIWPWMTWQWLGHVPARLRAKRTKRVSR